MYIETISFLYGGEQLILIEIDSLRSMNDNMRFARQCVQGILSSGI